MSYLKKSDLALTDVTGVVFDVDLSVVLDPAWSTEKVVDAGCHIFPFIVVSISKSRDWKCETFSWVHIYFVSQSSQSQRQQTHFCKCTLVVPIGKISIDFPQNLFLYLRSAKDPMKEDHLSLSYPSIPTQVCQFCAFNHLARRRSLYPLHGKQRLAGGGWPVVRGLIERCFTCSLDDHVTVINLHTCSATNRKPLSGLSHSYVSPRTGLKGFPPIL